MIAWAAEMVAAGGVPGVFLLMVLENLFPPMPSEVIMPLAGFAAAQGRMPLSGVLLAGVAGSVTGNAAWFELARAVGSERMHRLAARFGRWVGLGPEEVRKGEAALRRHGPAAVFLARMMSGIRTAISIPAGLVELPRRVFYVWMALGTLLWTGGLALAGWALEDRFHLVEDWAGPIGFGVMAVVLGGIALQIRKARRAA
jgi:membrane protein DedA with SNARE-associated domain